MAQHFKSSQEAIPVASLPVDKQTGVIQGVSILHQGLDKDGCFFSEKFLDDLTNATYAQPQGIKSRFGHPNLCQTALGTYIGRYKNFQIKNSDEGKYMVVADLHLDPITKKTQVEGKGISMYEYILEMAENNPDVFGNSIHFIGGMEEVEENIDGETQTVYSYTFQSLLASDLVDMPAATEGLFKSKQDIGLAIKTFINRNENVYDVVKNDPSILNGFLKKYAIILKTNKSKMKFLEKIKNTLGISKDIDLTLTDGSIITVVTDAQEPAIGDPVRDSDGNPLADGDYTLPDKRIISVMDGAISNIAEPGEEAEEEGKEDSVVSQEQGQANALEALKKQMKEHNKGLKELEETITMVAMQVVQIQRSFIQFKKTISPDKYTAPKTPMEDNSTKDMSTYTKMQDKARTKAEAYFEKKRKKVS